MSTRTIITAIAFYDTTDTDNAGWAYRLDYDDGHQESGALDATDPDAFDAAEFGAVIEANGGTVDGVGPRDGQIQYVDGGEGRYQWDAA